MQKYDKVVAKYGSAEKAQAFFDAMTKEGSPLKVEDKSATAVASQGKAREALGKHDMSFRVRWAYNMGGLQLFH
jgi:hypothetical protein